MSHHLIDRLTARVSHWHTAEAEDKERLRDYQRRLLALRQLSPRPHGSIDLALRQYKAVRKTLRNATHTLAVCRRHLREMAGATLP